MSNPYRVLFSSANTRKFSLAGFIARMPLPMMGIGIITMLSQLDAGYALAGAVSATFVLTYALASPQISRLVDQLGQSRILPFATMISIAGIIMLLMCAYYQLPSWTLFIGALLAGSMPSMSAMVRARWSAIYTGQPELQTAYSLETVLDEVSFITGPPLSVGLSVMIFPQAGPLAAAILLAIGVLCLVMQRDSEPAIEDRFSVLHNSRSVIKLSGVRSLIFLMIMMGFIVGTIDIVSVAFAELKGHPAAASLILSTYAVGSCLAGLLFGALKFNLSGRNLLLLGALATALAILPVLMINTIMGLSMVVFVSGLFFAPTMIVAISLVEAMVPSHKLTEGITWLLAGLNIGVAMGAALAGQLIDLHGVSAGFYIAVMAGGGVLVTAIWIHQRRI